MYINHITLYVIDLCKLYFLGFRHEDLKQFNHNYSVHGSSGNAENYYRVICERTTEIEEENNDRCKNVHNDYVKQYEKLIDQFVDIIPPNNNRYGDKQVLQLFGISPNEEISLEKSVTEFNFQYDFNQPIDTKYDISRKYLKQLEKFENEKLAPAMNQSPKITLMDVFNNGKSHGRVKRFTPFSMLKMFKYIALGKLHFKIIQ